MPFRQRAVVRDAHAHIPRALAVDAYPKVANNDARLGIGDTARHRPHIHVIHTVVRHGEHDCPWHQDPARRVLQKSHRDPADRPRRAQIDDHLEIRALVSLPSAVAEVGAASQSVDQRVVSARTVLARVCGIQPNRAALGNLVERGREHSARRATRDNCDRLHRRRLVDRDRHVISLRFRRRFGPVQRVVNLGVCRHIAERDARRLLEHRRPLGDERHRHDRIVDNRGPRNIRVRRSPLHVWPVAHLEDDLAPARNRGVLEKRPGIRSAVQPGTGDVTRRLRDPRRADHETRSVLEPDRRLRKQRRADHVLVRARRHAVETERAHHEPRAHLSAVLVADQTVGTVRVHRVHEPAHHCLRLPRLARERVQIRDVVAWLVAVRVLADHAGDVGLLVPGNLALGAEQRVELRRKRALPTEKIHQTVHVLRRKKRILPGICLCVVKVDLGGIEWREPRSLEPAPHESNARVEEILVALRAPHVARVVVQTPQLSRHQCDAPVVVRVLERLRNALGLLLGRDVSGAAVALQAATVLLGAVLHRLERNLFVKAGDPLHHRIRNDRHGVVSDHAVGLVACELPYGQSTAFLVLPDERPHEVTRAAPVRDRHQRMERPKRIPQREHGVVVEVVRPVNHQVATAIAAVDVDKDIRAEQRVVERRIEDRPLPVVSAVDLDP